MTIKTKLIASFGVLLLLSIVFGSVVFSSMASVREQFGLVVERDTPVIANANRLLKLIVDMETGQRGFCITQKEEFLEPYNTACGEFHELLEAEKDLCGDDRVFAAGLQNLKKFAATFWGIPAGRAAQAFTVT